MKLRKKQKQKIFYCILGLFLLIAMYLDTFLLLKYNILPFKYLIVYYVVAGLIPILLICYTLFKKKKSKLKIFFGFLEILYIFVLIFGFFYLNKTFNFIDDFTQGFEYETKNYYVVTLKNNYYDSIESLKDKNIGYSKGLDESIDKAIEELKKKISFVKNESDGYGVMFEKLDNGESDAIIIINSYYDMLLENEENQDEFEYKIVYQFSIKEKFEEVEVRDVDVTKEPFNLYISGIDSYGSVTDKTRSDVNIVMSVNPKTKKILMINIPRDYYVEIAGTGQNDKLTHAGIRGVDTSVKTIENLLEIEINYYIKVNYNALIKLVDALGGVDVYSEYNFSSYELHHRFKEGYNHVNGKQALDFVRTRKAFQNGDRVRGENQQRMIQAIIKKACSASVLLKYDGILKSLEGSFTTNMSTKNITSLINMQLKDMANWDITSISVNGSDGHALLYGQELYVMMPDEETVEEAKLSIINIMNN